MGHASGEQEPSRLTLSQSSILEGFVSHYVENSNSEPTFTGYYDQASAFVRNTIVEKFGLALDTPEQYYAVMAGLSVGTVWIEGLVAQGLSVNDAAEVMRISLARLYPGIPNN